MAVTSACSATPRTSLRANFNEIRGSRLSGVYLGPGAAAHLVGNRISDHTGPYKLSGFGVYAEAASDVVVAPDNVFARNDDADLGGAGWGGPSRGQQMAPEKLRPSRNPFR